MLYKKNFYLIFALALVLLGFASVPSLTRHHPAPNILIVSSLLFFGLYAYEAMKTTAAKAKNEEADFHTRMLTNELNKLQTLLDNNMITQEEFEVKRDSLKVQYANQVNTYMNF
ncbi:SHOCT domain-containing protein [Paenibacillus sp. M2]|uniref:SHOCT domain-containing protein n=1 Tax=Paenibacillus sp. M2 TaxID=3341793 RepID=UPI00398A2DBC